MQAITPQPVFLTAEWRRLIMANYEIDPSVLQAFVPFGTELDTWKGRHYVSLVGFMFLDTRLKGVSIPFHKNFEEINLRFYVRYKDPEVGWKRGTVFIKEIVPKAAITLVANSFYGENYVTLPTRHRWEDAAQQIYVEYGWKQQKEWQHIGVHASPTPSNLPEGGEAEFITEHYWGYVHRKPDKSTQYQVEHIPWRIHEVHKYDIHCHASSLYGPGFGEAMQAEPLSVFLAEGSKVIVREGKKIS